jgi:predicted HicB family RNase H-like nuclease
MVKRTPPKVTLDTPFGAEVDLDREVRRDQQGRRITRAYADRVIAAARKPGRPALADDGPSPAIAFRLPRELRSRAEALAAKEGKTVSQLAREALESRLEAS